MNKKRQMDSKMEDAPANNGKSPSKQRQGAADQQEVSPAREQMDQSRDTIQFKFEEGKLTGVDNMQGKLIQSDKEYHHEMLNYRMTTDRVAQMLLKVLE